ncbi:unnamed protein product [Caenorhabditis nigoni]
MQIQIAKHREAICMELKSSCFKRFINDRVWNCRKPVSAEYLLRACIDTTKLRLITQKNRLGNRSTLRHPNQDIITLFVSFAVGSLSGSSFYHLLPQAHADLMDENREPMHSSLHLEHISILGVYAFFFCVKLIKIIFEIRKKNQHIHHRRLSNENPGNMSTERNDSTLLVIRKRGC